MRKISAGVVFLACLAGLQFWSSLQAPATERAFGPRQSDSIVELAQAVTGKPAAKDQFMSPAPQRAPTFRAKIKGAHCLRDPSCSSGLGRVFCKTSDPESCEPTGVCCAKAPPKRPRSPPPICPVRCDVGNMKVSCCPTGNHCCTQFSGCCPNGTSCQSWFGFNFCFDNPL